MTEKKRYRLVEDPLSDRYVGQVPAFATPEEPPPVEFEVRHLMAAYKSAWLTASSCRGWWGWLTHEKAEIDKHESVLAERREELIAVLKKSEVHRAAFRRVVHSIQPGRGGKDAFDEFLSVVA